LDPQDLARTSCDPLGLSRLSDAGGIDASREDGAGIFADETGTFRVLQVEPARSDLNYREAAVLLGLAADYGLVRAILRPTTIAASFASSLPSTPTSKSLHPGKSRWRKPQRTQRAQRRTVGVGGRGCRTRREFLREMRRPMAGNRAEITGFVFFAFFAVI
jgi:hypothetical protein